MALGSITLPAWWWAMPADAQYLSFQIDTWRGVDRRRRDRRRAAARRAASLQRPLALAQAHLARRLLGPSLAARVERLTETRAGAVDAAAAELQRIERDLHDGAQARLVALAMDLGMAEERFDRDPEGARELRRRGAPEAKRALAELRDLARGMRPSLLAERGLGPAIAALAARSPVPATATVDVPRRPPAPVETAAWFVVSEALANAAKHSDAERATIWVTQRNGNLHVEVVDDGRGGADAAGAGLKGLAQRVEALDGTLEVNSPPGGPTRRASIAAVRVVIAEDLALLRDGLERLLRDSGFDVVAAVADGPALLDAVDEHRPRRGDRRRPAPARVPRRGRPRGARAARAAAGLPGPDPLPVRRADLRRRAAGRRRGGVGYLLKDRVSDVRDFVEAVRRVASGGMALDPEAVSSSSPATRTARSTSSARASARSSR